MGAQAEAKLVNDPQHAVREMLEGLVTLHDHMALLDGFDHVRSHPPTRKSCTPSLRNPSWCRTGRCPYRGLRHAC